MCSLSFFTQESSFPFKMPSLGTKLLEFLLRGTLRGSFLGWTSLLRYNCYCAHFEDIEARIKYYLLKVIKLVVELGLDSSLLYDPFLYLKGCLKVFFHCFQFGSVQSLSRVQLFVSPWTEACQASLSITSSQSLLKLMSIESVMPSNHLILCCPLLLLPSVFPSIRVFSSESVTRIRWPKYWSFNFSISRSNEHSGLISFRMDWLDILAVQGTLQSLLQHHSSKASILSRSAFFIVQLSHPYMTTEKTIALTRRTFVGKVMSLLFNMLSRLVITLLPRSKHLLISWLQSPSAFIQP